MATVLLLQHPESSKKFPPIRLRLTGATLVTDIGGGSNIQNLPSGEEAKELLDRVLRLRRDEGYRVVERGETADDEVEPVDDPITRLYKLREAGRRALLDFEEDPVTPEEVEEVLARLAAAAPACIDFLRTANVPGGLLAAPLAGKAFPSVRSLIFAHHRLPRHEPAPLDDLASFFAALPNLERVDASGQFALREASHPVLSELHLRGAPLFADAVAALGGGALPALTLLDLSLGEEHSLDRAAASALCSLAAPSLGTIYLGGIKDITRFLAALTKDQLPPSWAKLHCRGGVDDEDNLLAVLQQRASTLASLAELGLPLAEALSEGGVAQAKRLLPQIVDVSELPDPWPPTASAVW